MRVVVDTNTIVSGLFWHGAPRRVLDAARTGRIQLFTSPVLLAELEDVLSRKNLVNGACWRKLLHMISLLAMPRWLS